LLRTFLAYWKAVRDFWSGFRSFYLLRWSLSYLRAIVVLVCPTIVLVGFGGNLVIMIASTAVAAFSAGISYRLIERPFMDT
jgi:hypothetical protein